MAIASISCAIRGKAKDEYEEDLNKAIKELTELGFEIISKSIYNRVLDPDFPILNHDLVPLSISISHLCKINVLYMCKGWENSRGCKFEHDIAKAYSIPIVYQDNVSAEIINDYKNINKEIKNEKNK